MFTIKVDGQDLYNPALFDEQYQVINPELTLEVNKAGSLTFTMPPCNAMWGSLDKLTSIITVEQDGIEIFRGRVMNDETDTWKQRSVYCEGELAFLLDSIQRPYEFSGNAADLFRQLVTNHNECVNAEKQFTIGRITAVDRTTEAAIESGEHSNTFTEINDRLLNAYGGYIRIRKGAETRYIDYLSKAGDDNTQPIQLGVNLLDLKESISAEDVFTVLIPTGAMQKGDNGRYTELTKVSSVNNGLDYIEDAEGVARYGRIWKTKHWDCIDDPQTLKEKGHEYLQTGIAEDATLTIKAIDLHFVDPGKQRIGIGDMVQLLSDPHGLDRVTICYKIVMPLQEPERTVYTFGEPKRALTDNIVLTDDEVKRMGGGGGDQSVEQEVQDVLRWAYAQADNETARYELLTGEVNNVTGRTSAAEFKLSGIEAELLLMAKKKELDELTGEFNTLETNVSISADGLREIIQRNDKTISELKATIDGLEHWVTDSDGNIAELTNTVRGLESKVTTADGKVSILTNTADGLTSTLLSQGGDVAQFKTRIDEISATVRDTNGSIGSLSVKADSVTAKVSGVGDKVSQLAVTADGLSYTLTKQGQEIASLKALIDEISLTVNDTNGAMGQFVVQSGRIAGKLEDAHGKLTALQELTEERFRVVLGDIETIEGDIKTIEGSTLWQDKDKIVAAVGKVSTLEGNISTITGSTLWQDKDKIVAAVGKVSTLEGEVSDITGSALWQDRANIAGVVGKMSVGADGKIYIKSGSGLMITKGSTSYGVYDANNLTGGLMVQKINADTTTTISGTKVNLEASESFKLKVGKGEVISAINATSEKVTIQASKINLSGYVTASQLSAEIADINLNMANTVATDTLRASSAIISFLTFKDTYCTLKEGNFVTSVTFPAYQEANLYYLDWNGEKQSKLVLLPTKKTAGSYAKNKDYKYIGA